LQAQSRWPQRPRRGLEADPFRALLHERPRALGQPRRMWPLRVAAEVWGERGLTPYQVSLETVRPALKRLGVNWRWATRWITSPDPPDAFQNSHATA
jgi:hypothetical protein